ncbi:hypothetical protein Tco_1341021, partial [Tanacetum coccineum]
TLNVVTRKNEREAKKNKDIVVEPPKKKKKVGNSSKKKKKVEEEEAQNKIITYNLYGFVWSLKIFILEIFPNSKYWWKKDPAVLPRGISWSIIEKFHKGDYSCLFAQCSNPILAFGPSDYEFVQPWCVCSFEYISNLDEPGSRYYVGDVLVEVVEPEQKLICSGGDTAEEQMQVDSNNHFDVHAKDQDSPYPYMDEYTNIHSNVHVEDQNSPIMDKEDLLADFDGIKATLHIIDKRKGKVATSCLEKELDLVKDKIAMLEKAFKLRYQDNSEDSVQQVCYKQHELSGSKSVSAVLDVFHQVVASETHDCAGEGSGFIYADSQDKFSVLQLLQVAINEKSGPVVDCTQLEVDNKIDWCLPNMNQPFSQSQIYGSVGFENMLDPGCKDELADDND